MKTKKRKKVSRMHGRKMGTHGGGARKKNKKSGHSGGGGMSGSGKRADHKKTLVTNLYGNKYFGKQGITSKGTKKDKKDRISLKQIELNLENYVKKGLAKPSNKGFEINLKNYKILGSGKDYILKNKLIITAKDASKSVIEIMKKMGGEIKLDEKKSKDSEAKPKKVSKENVK